MTTRAIGKSANEPAPRERLLRAAFDEIYHQGYQGARVDAILENTGLTKGAFYYYFKSKRELGYAVVDEVVAAMAADVWRDALSRNDDPVAGIMAALDCVGSVKGADFVHLGCPINNLSQEMAALDEGFRDRLNAILQNIIDWIAEALRRGRDRGVLKSDIDCAETAAFLVAAFEGCVGLAKTRQSADMMATCRRQITVFMDALRAG